MLRPVHFEIHVGDVDRAREFYSTVFGWRFQQWGDEQYWLIFTGQGPGIDGGLLPRKGSEPSDETPIAAFATTMEVEDVDAMLSIVESAGGRVAMPRTALTGMGWVAYCRDTEGNIFGMFQADDLAS
ncbi:VOC family protein [Saccharopolyspora elongata]|uniref:VOC family protein n=1 Tax=Saccharopolyspora elongata TaxID=2530387 RepID=A0A4R4YYQ8_9PSEU|nr:VOC family protein [Saccharopolyspora elongata]TDD50556.1 VOC family protein [Saccharopolyspora elongata]